MKSDWKIILNNIYDLEFYEGETFVLGMNSKNTFNPFVVKYIYYDHTFFQRKLLKLLKSPLRKVSRL